MCYTVEDVSQAGEADAEAAGEVEPAGHFRLYLGAAPGVGKTYAMLSEANGLEVIPRKVIDYRGTRLEELDLDAVLRRHPEIALVDELAHTNVPGSGPHGKRWQDVVDILGAGIDVITTVNIQHLESIADEVEEMTGAKVRERVPDWVVRKADQIELIDSSPEQLRRRMLHGNIYPKEKVAQALTHFFRTDNLIALRELALRFVADESDEDLLEHLRRHHPVDPVDPSRLRSGGRRPSASWWPSRRRRGPTWSCGAPPASHCGSRGNSMWSTSWPATPARLRTAGRSKDCESWPPASVPAGTS
jgi:K+-sensing histidine kinase KdpD